MFQLTTMAVRVNNEVVAIAAGTLKFTEGLGEQSMRAASVGYGETEQVFVDDVSTAFGEVKWEMDSTPVNIRLAREWKGLKNANVVAIEGSTPDGDVLTRTYTQAALTTNYEVSVGPDGTIPIDFIGNKAI